MALPHSRSDAPPRTADPTDDDDALTAETDTAAARRRQDENAPSPASTLPPGAPELPNLLGSSPALRHLRELIERIAPTDRALLIQGPTGAGKEVVARQIHLRGHRAEAPFIDVNCGAIPEHLVESELFGHAKGAFTGAVGERAGYFRSVGHGTLFLDEIGELPLALQPKLLRVLETRRFRPLGASEALPFEGRIVAATHRDLQAMAKEGRFREDLFHRLAVFVVEMPALAQRREDIPGLARHFAALQPRRLSFTPEAMQLLCHHGWPGNVRQLRNVIDRLGVLADDTRIDAATLACHLAPEHGRKPPDAPPAEEALADALLELPGADKLAAAQDLLIDRALYRCAGNKSAAAQLLGVGRKTIERRLKARDAEGQAVEALLAQSRALAEASAFREAIPLLWRCVDQLRDGRPRQADTRIHFEAFRLLGLCLLMVNGWLSYDAQKCYAAALGIGRDCCDPQELAPLQFGLWIAQLMGLELSRARATAQEMMQWAQINGSPALLDEAHVALANTLFWLGDCDEALACLERGGFLDGAGDAERISAQGFELVGLALTFEGLSAFQLGQFSRARAAMETLILRAAPGRHQHAFTQVVALQGAAWLACLFEDMPRLGDLSTRLADLALKHDFAFYHGIGQFFRGCHLAAQGRHAEGEQTMREGYEGHMLRHGGKLFHSFQAWKRGTFLLQAGDAAACAALAEHALEIALEHQERAYLGELQVLKAQALRAQGRPHQAEQELYSAFSTALALGSVPARTAAARELASILHHAGRTAQATELLTRALRGTDASAPCHALAQTGQLLADIQQSIHLTQGAAANGV